MDQMTIETTPAVGSSVIESAPVVRILRHFRERLECLSADVITLARAVDNNDSNAISELETVIRTSQGWSESGDGGMSSAAASS